MFVSAYGVRVFESVTDATPAEPQGVYDEKGRYYKY